MRPLAPGVWTSPQPSPDHMAPAAAAGVRRVINNRPDHEEPGQPTSAKMEAAARAAGMDYLWIPVRGMPGPAEAAAVGETLDDGTPTLLFCRSGTRSTVAWAMARRARGDDPEDLRTAAARAGYDLSRLPL